MVLLSNKIGRLDLLFFFSPRTISRIEVSPLLFRPQDDAGDFHYGIFSSPLYKYLFVVFSLSLPPRFSGCPASIDRIEYLLLSLPLAGFLHKTEAPEIWRNSPSMYNFVVSLFFSSLLLLFPQLLSSSSDLPRPQRIPPGAGSSTLHP